MLFLLPGPPHAPIHTKPTPPPHPTHTKAVINKIHTSLDPYTPIEDNQIVKATKGLQTVSKTHLQRRGHPSRVIRLSAIRIGDVRLRDWEGQDEWQRRMSLRWKDMKTEGPSVLAFHLRDIRLCLPSVPSVSGHPSRSSVSGTSFKSSQSYKSYYFTRPI